MFACSRKTDSSLSEGRIEFEILYLQDRVGAYSSSMMPRKMLMEYKDNMTRNIIEGGLGFFNLVNVSDLKNYRNTTYLKFIDKKYIYQGKKRETPCCFGKLEGMLLEFTDRTKEVEGFECKHAMASFPDDHIEPFDIWYTEEIPLDHPNGNSPFRDVPGVMLEFNSLLGDVTIHMQATRYEAIQLNDKDFRPPQDYRPVTKAEMEKIIHALLD